VNGRHALAIVCLAAGVPLAAWGLAGGGALAALLGLALVMVFVGMAYAWIAGAQRPMGAEQPVKPAANAAWSMKDQPAGGAGAERRDQGAPGERNEAANWRAPGAPDTTGERTLPVEPSKPEDRSGPVEPR
jgi:hypothetical protein